MFSKSSDSFLTTIILWAVHIISSVMDMVASWWWGRRLQQAGVQQYFFWRGATDGNIKAFFELLKLLENAIDVKIAVGEMGNRLMQNEQIIKGLEHAYTKNKANIEIIHGPRVDPDTTIVFDMARAGKVSLYCMPVYRSHHFFLITDKNGMSTTVEEGRHLETRWKYVNGHTNGQWKESAHSLVRTYFVSNTRGRSQALNRVFRTRKMMSSYSYEPPSMEKNKQTQLTFENRHGWVRLFLDIWWVWKLKLYYQQKAIINENSDDVDLHEKWVIGSKWHGYSTEKISIFTDDVPDRAIQMYESRIAPDVLVGLRNTIELVGKDVALGINEFRDFHMLEFGVDSVGYLDCSSSLFKVLIENGIDTGSELKSALPSLLKKYQTLAEELNTIEKQLPQSSKNLHRDPSPRLLAI